MFKMFKPYLFKCQFQDGILNALVLSVVLTVKLQCLDEGTVKLLFVN